MAVQPTAPYWGPPLVDGGGGVSSMFYHTAGRLHVTLRSGLDMAAFPMWRGTHLECNDTQRVSGANLH